MTSLGDERSKAAVDERLPLTRMRRAIANAMTASALVPQFTLEVDADLRALGAWRVKHARRDRPISYSDLLTASVAAALRTHPSLNASFDDDAIVRHAEINVGFALDLGDALVVPAIRRADRKSLPELQAERKRLMKAAAEGRLGPEDLLMTTFTISNLGPLGIRRFRALVVPPQAAILAVGSVTESERISLSLSCDHRVLDGAEGARYLSRVAALLEQPEWLEELLTDA